MSTSDAIGLVLLHTPAYVWLLLATAITLGARRLKPRRRHLAIAAIAPALFLVWGLVTAVSIEAHPRAVVAVSAWCFTLGAASTALRAAPRPQWVRGWIFDFAPTRLPMLAYLCLFCAHYGIGIWAGFAPQLSGPLSLARLSLSALTAGRTCADFLPLLLQGLSASRSRVQAR